MVGPDLALTGSDLEPTSGFGFSNGTTDDADGSKLEPHNVLRNVNAPTSRAIKKHFYDSVCQ